MGYHWPVQLKDGHSDEWTGEHRPELIDLRPLFARLIEMRPGENLPIEEWRAVLPPELHLVRMLGPRSVHVHTRAAQVRDLVIKLCLPRLGSRWRRLTAPVRHSRSHRAYFWAHRLRALGIETPRPLGFIERAHQPAMAMSFTVSEYIFAPTLTELRDQAFAPAEGRADALLEKRTLIRRVAELIDDLHRRGLFHGDLHAGNLLVAEGSLVLIDLESVRSARLRSRGQLANLVRLNRDFLDTKLVSRADRLRFLEAYLRRDGDRTERRELFARVATETDKKLAERGEAFT
ncbi:MAG: phosphotransferase [Deltaproteobacteria bacterium]|nr:phosphotransferase [Deltaproteobacteria bacterium]